MMVMEVNLYAIYTCTASKTHLSLAFEHRDLQTVLILMLDIIMTMKEEGQEYEC